MSTRRTRLPDGSRLGLRVEVQTERNQDEWDVGTLTDTIELHGVELPAGTMMTWDPDLPILCATLRTRHDFRGLPLTPGCRFEFTPNHFFGFPGLSIPVWLFPIIILYAIYRLIRRALIGTGPSRVRLYFPTEAGRPNPKVALYDVDPKTLLPVAAPPSRPPEDS